MPAATALSPTATAGRGWHALAVVAVAYDSTNPAHVRALSEALAAYQLLMENVLTAQKYWEGDRIEHEGTRVWGNIVERAAARMREHDQEQAREARA